MNLTQNDVGVSSGCLSSSSRNPFLEVLWESIVSRCCCKDERDVLHPLTEFDLMATGLREVSALSFENGRVDFATNVEHTSMVHVQLAEHAQVQVQVHT